jgi:hypothetical protein
MTFADRLRGWRGAMRQKDLAAAIGKSQAYVASLEGGVVPDRAVCEAIGKVLNLPDAGEVWRTAAPERLQALDADLAEWHATEVDAARGYKLDPHEQRMLDALRSLPSDDRSQFDMFDRSQFNMFEDDPESDPFEAPRAPIGAMELVRVGEWMGDRRFLRPFVGWVGSLGKIASARHRSEAMEQACTSVDLLVGIADAAAELDSAVHNYNSVGIEIARSESLDDDSLGRFIHRYDRLVEVIEDVMPHAAVPSFGRPAGKAGKPLPDEAIFQLMDDTRGDVWKVVRSAPDFAPDRQRAFEGRLVTAMRSRISGMLADEHKFQPADRELIATLLREADDDVQRLCAVVTECDLRSDIPF